jgi:chromosome partitioning protein
MGLDTAENAIQSTYMPFLDILPSTIDLVGAEVELVNIENRELQLKEPLNNLREKYDYIFIDCAPSLGLLTLNALTAADSVIIPVQCEYFALEGLGQLLNTINLVRKNLNPALSIEGVLLTMFDRRLNLSQQVRDEVNKYFGEKVFKSVINRNVRISEAPSHAKPVLLYDSISIGAKNYMELASELIERTKQQQQQKIDE